MRDFTSDLVMEFRQFIYDEYKYVPLYPALYPHGEGHRPPQKRLRDTTVVHDLKLLQAFFAELENTDEISRSPFRKISVEKRRRMMHVMYDAPVFLRAEELRQVMATEVPAELQWAKDLFVLNCAIGCRISDLLRPRRSSPARRISTCSTRCRSTTMPPASTAKAAMPCSDIPGWN